MAVFLAGNLSWDVRVPFHEVHGAENGGRATIGRDPPQLSRLLSLCSFGFEILTSRQRWALSVRYVCPASFSLFLLLS